MGKELLLRAIKGEKTERTPWVPFVGCHGGALIGEDAETYLKSGELMAEGAREAIRRYNPDGIPVAFDLSVEAEILGCRLEWARENPPAVVSHVLSESALSDLPPLDRRSGRIPEIVKAIGILKKQEPDIGLYGLITGPFTLALHLRGTDIFMDMYDKPEDVKELVEYCSRIGAGLADIYIEAGCDIISLVDPMTSQISPDAFREFVTPFAGVRHTVRSRIFRSRKESKHPVFIFCLRPRAEKCRGDV
jgi:uroporphyrinogen decarboxylase